MTPPPDRFLRIRRGIALALLAATVLTAYLLFDTRSTESWQGKMVLIPKGSRLPDVVRILREDEIPRSSTRISGRISSRRKTCPPPAWPPTRCST